MLIVLIRRCIIGQRRRKTGIAQIPGMIARQSQGCRKDSGFVAAAAMLGIQSVIPQLVYIDDRAFSIRQFHQAALSELLFL